MVLLGEQHDNRQPEVFKQFQSVSGAALGHLDG
jgi:hypothetical protein